MTGFTAIPIEAPPGLYAETTDVDARGRWVDGSNMRFWKGRPQRFGGSATLLDSANTSSPIRGIRVFNRNSGEPVIAFGSADKLCVYNSIEYDITPATLAAGPVDAVNPSGYGEGLYGTGFYGGATLLAVSVTPPRTWSIDNYGEDLIAVASDDQTIWYWDSSGGYTSNPATALANAPTAQGALVTDSRHIMAFGAGGDALRIEWCDQEDITSWTPAATNTAGGFNLELGTRIMGWARTAQGILVVTDLAVYILRYIGGQFVFSRTLVGTNCGALGPLSIVARDNGAMWMGANAFYMFNGSVTRVPCDVHSDVFGDLNTYQSGKTCGGTNTLFGEWIWFYPSAASTENDRCVIYSPQNGWSKGTLARTAWWDVSQLSPQYPITADASGVIYQQDVPDLEDSLAWSLNLAYRHAGEGSAHVFVRKFLPDFQKQYGNVFLTIKTRDEPEGVERTKGPYTITTSTSEVPIRARGRFLTFEMSGTGECRLGAPRMLARAMGSRL